MNASTRKRPVARRPEPEDMDERELQWSDVPEQPPVPKVEYPIKHPFKLPKLTPDQLSRGRLMDELRKVGLAVMFLPHGKLTGAQVMALERQSFLDGELHPDLPVVPWAMRYGRNRKMIVN